jgi:hypothetical protein
MLRALYTLRNQFVNLMRSENIVSRQGFPSAIAAVVLAVTACSAAAQNTATSCDQLASTIGGRAAQAGTVCRVTLPRGDLSVSLLGAKLPAGMGLTSWAAFLPMGSAGHMVMGDLALTPDELPEVMKGLRDAGIEVTAVHRHMLGEKPDVAFMHYMGMGTAAELSRKLRSALDRKPSALGKAPAAAQATNVGVVAGTACAEIQRILGASGSPDTGPGYCKVTIPRPENEVSMHGVKLPPGPMGIASWYAFRETDDGTAAVIAGDMALPEDRINAAVAALRAKGIEVVVLHNHMMGEQPRIMFFHFQARGSSAELARGLRAGIDAAAR